jgi:hypothetical protein
MSHVCVRMYRRNGVGVCITVYGCVCAMYYYTRCVGVWVCTREEGQVGTLQCVRKESR